jgi:hypothetical protein
MLYLSNYSDAMKASTDWVIVCKGGEQLLCHSLVLSGASKVLAGLDDTTGKLNKDGKKLISFEDEDNFDDKAGHQFLRWVYTQSVNLTVSTARTLALFGHKYDAPGQLLFLFKIKGSQSVITVICISYSKKRSVYVII